MKDKIYNQMNLTNFDPIFLQSLDSKQLDTLIKKISLDLSGLNNVVSENLRKSDSILNEIDNIPTNQMAQILHSVPENKNVIVHNDKPDKPDKSDNQDNQIKYHDILIKSSDYDEPKNYSDYMVELGDNKYNNVTSFQLINIKVPKVANIINASSNKLRYIVDDSEVEIDVATGSYDSYSLTLALQKMLSPNFSLTIDSQGKISIQNDFNKTFDIINNGKSVLRHLGFTKVNYIGKKSYIADELPSIDKKYDTNLFIEGVLDEKPIISYGQDDNPNKLCPITVKFDKPLSSLPEIFIKFKADSNPDSQNLVDFHGEPHELLFRVGCLN